MILEGDMTTRTAILTDAIARRLFGASEPHRIYDITLPGLFLSGPDARGRVMYWYRKLNSNAEALGSMSVTDARILAGKLGPPATHCLPDFTDASIRFDDAANDPGAPSLLHVTDRQRFVK
jgi:hypothetical protein